MAGPAISPRQILVVDDEPAVADTIRMVLGLDGHQTEVAADAEGALAKFEAGRYGLVVTDLSLPKMDGIGLARELRKRDPKQPIILITAYAESIAGDRERLKDVTYLLGKPFSVDQLRHAVAQIFSRS
jgi:CheY-like chemotaxis protein